MPDLRYGEHQTTYEIVRSARKTLAVMVSLDGAVVVRAPYNAGSARVTAFVDRLKPWIFKQLARRQVCRLVTGERLPYLGKKYYLRVAVNGAGGDARVELKNTRLVVSVGRDSGEAERRQAVQEALTYWYWQEAQRLLPLRVIETSRRLGVCPTGIKVKRQARRWGSCTAGGVVNLNWQLVMAPPEVIDYVVVHELCHLEVRSHQREFWDLVARHAPDYKKQRKWLRVNGHALGFLSA